MPRFWQFVRKKNYNQYIFLLFALLLVNAILQNQRKKIYKYRNNTVYKKKNNGLGGDSLTVTVFSLHFL